MIILSGYNPDYKGIVFSGIFRFGGVNLNIAHSGFISSKGLRGWYTTVEDNEIIEFDKSVNSLIIETKDEKPLAIQIDNLDDIWHISGGTQEGLSGLRIKKMTVLEDAGTMIKWKALTY